MSWGSYNLHFTQEEVQAQTAEVTDTRSQSDGDRIRVNVQSGPVLADFNFLTAL